MSKVVPFSPADTGTVGLKFNIDLLLAEEVGVNAGGSFRIEGELDHDANGRQKWKFKRLGMDQFRIATSFPGAKIAGLLEWYDDTDNNGTWGKGFRGLLDAEFTGIGVDLKAVAQFGRKEDYKYFFVDALVEFGAVAPGAGVLQLKGFGGGISYKMDVNAAQIDFANVPSNNGFPPIGQSFSGTSYTPHGGKRLGLKATAIIATVKEEVFSGTVSLLFQFNDENGLDKIAMLGSAKMLSPIDIGIKPDFLPNSLTKPVIPTNPVISAYASIEFDFGKKAFHGSLNTFINAGGILVGAGEGGKATTAEIHFDPQKWYIYIGTPQLEPGGPITTCGTKISIPFIAEAVNQSYFCIGSVVPASPPIPQEVRSIAYKLRDNPSLRQSGAGLIFGASRQINMDISIAGIVSARLDAKFGYDVMLRKYDGFVCQQDGQPIGLDGWYAAGQAYAYIYGELKVFGVNVASAGIAAALQARLPNPFYAQAVVGLKLKIGFIKVNKSLSIELGNDDCILVSDDPGSEIGMEVIVAMTPLDNDTDVETITVPEASLALGLDRDYTMASIANGVDYQYRVELNEATLTQAESGVNIPAEILITNDGTQVRMKPLVEMPGGDSVTFTVKLDVFRDGQHLSVEEKSVTFMTAQRMDYIPEANIKSTYPVDGMYNFYKNEYVLGEGFIELETGQPQLLTQIPSGYSQQVRLTSSTGVARYISYQYDYSEDRVNFPLSPGSLNSGELYRLELVRRSAPAITSTAAALQNIDYFMEGSGDEDVSGPNPGAANTQPDNEIEEKILYTAYFRVSNYGSFDEKMNAITAQPQNILFNLSTAPFELFDALETSSLNGKESLVSLSVDLDVPWMTNEVQPMLEDFVNTGCSAGPVFESLDLFASASELTEIDLSVSPIDWDKGIVDNLPQGQSIRYNLVRAVTGQILNLIVTQSDCMRDQMGELQAQVGPDCNLNEPPDTNVFFSACNDLKELNRLYMLRLPVIDPGQYGVDVEYRLPDGQLTSSYTVNFIK